MRYRAQVFKRVELFLAEFWQIEPEVCFADLHDIIEIAEDFIKNIIKEGTFRPRLRSRYPLKWACAYTYSRVNDAAFRGHCIKGYG